MKHTVRHTLAPDKAKDVLEHALGTYREHYSEYDVETGWADDDTAEVGFRMTGNKVRGEIKVLADRYDIDFKLPWMYRPFTRRIAVAVEEELQRWLARA